MDVASVIEVCLRNKWELPIPNYIGGTNESIDLLIRKDELDPKRLNFQILLENLPESSVWVTRGIYRVEHKVRITIYLKLVHYNPDTVDSFRVFWYDAKREINTILARNKFNLPNIVDLDLPTGWDDRTSIAVGRGIKTTTEPIIWMSEQVVTATYYTGEELEEE